MDGKNWRPAVRSLMSGVAAAAKPVVVIGTTIATRIMVVKNVVKAQEEGIWISSRPKISDNPKCFEFRVLIAGMPVDVNVWPFSVISSTNNYTTVSLDLINPLKSLPCSKPGRRKSYTCQETLCWICEGLLRSCDLCDKIIIVHCLSHVSSFERRW